MQKKAVYRKLKLALALGVLFVTLAVALLGALIRPDKTQDANDQLISIAKLPPLADVKMLKVRKNKLFEHQFWYELLLNGGRESEFMLVPIKGMEVQEHRVKVEVFNTSGIEEYRYYLFQDVLFALSDSALIELGRNRITDGVLTDLTGQQIEFNREAMIAEIESEHVVRKRFLLGSDPYGRDMLSRLMAGSYVTLMVGVSSVLMALIIGVLIGICAGYFGGILDRVLLWLMNVFWSVPAILLVISVTLVLGQGVMALVLGIGLILWVEMAQVIRGEVKSLSQKEYVKAARLMGLSNFRILYFHILPNLSGPILVLAVSNFAQAILLEAGLNFLGVGIRLPKPSWGGMVRELYGFLITDGAYLAIVPSLAIVILVLSVVVLGASFQDRFKLKYGVTLRRG
ncbi:MAG: ABC transporter permease [Salibacteraceae bacterium]|nr:ABC transporter permease [Salibacteraceae bacterium]